MVSLGLFWTGGSKVEGLSVPNVAEKKNGLLKRRTGSAGWVTRQDSLRR